MSTLGLPFLERFLEPPLGPLGILTAGGARQQSTVGVAVQAHPRRGGFVGLGSGAPKICVKMVLGQDG